MNEEVNKPSNIGIYIVGGLSLYVIFKLLKNKVKPIDVSKTPPFKSTITKLLQTVEPEPVIEPEPSILPAAEPVELLPSITPVVKPVIIDVKDILSHPEPVYSDTTPTVHIQGSSPEEYCLDHAINGDYDTTLYKSPEEYLLNDSYCKKYLVFDIYNNMIRNQCAKDAMNSNYDTILYKSPEEYLLNDPYCKKYSPIDTYYHMIGPDAFKLTQRGIELRKECVKNAMNGNYNEESAMHYLKSDYCWNGIFIPEYNVAVTAPIEPGISTITPIPLPRYIPYLIYPNVGPVNSERIV